MKVQEQFHFLGWLLSIEFFLFLLLGHGFGTRGLFITCTYFSFPLYIFFKSLENSTIHILKDFGELNPQKMKLAFTIVQRAKPQMSWINTMGHEAKNIKVVNNKKTQNWQEPKISAISRLKSMTLYSEFVFSKFNIKK